MTFYNIIWLTIFSLGGISLGLFGLVDLNYFSILLINPRIFNRLISRTEDIYLAAKSQSIPENAVTVSLQSQKF